MTSQKEVCAVSRIRDMDKHAVYIAGPMTGIENHNFDAFNQAAEMLSVAGFEVVNPADHGVVEAASWADYLRYDLQRISECGAIYFLRGWEASRGAVMEWTVSHQLGLEKMFQEGASQEPDKPFLKTCLGMC